jgi:hypothetical protein
MGDAGEVKNNFSLFLSNQLVCGPLHLAAVVAQCDFSRHFQDNNIGLQVLGLNVQGHEPSSFQI